VIIPSVYKVYESFGLETLTCHKAGTVPPEAAAMTSNFANYANGILDSEP